MLNRYLRAFRALTVAGKTIFTGAGVVFLAILAADPLDAVMRMATREPLAGRSKFWVEVPHDIELNERKELTVRFDFGAVGLQAPQNVGATLQAPGFKSYPAGPVVAPSQTLLSWVWTLQPETIGRHVVDIEFDQPIVDVNVPAYANKLIGDTFVGSTANSLTFAIDVGGMLGLTRLQAIWTRVTIGGLGLMATMLWPRFAPPFFVKKKRQRRRRRH